MNFTVLPWYFSAPCFPAFYSIRSNFEKWFVSQNMEPRSIRSTSRGVLTVRVKMNMLAIRSFFSISEIDSHHILSERLSCDRVIKQDPGNLVSQPAC